MMFLLQRRRKDYDSRTSYRCCRLVLLLKARWGYRLLLGRGATQNSIDRFRAQRTLRFQEF
jgi:hypothetical protein